MFDNTLQDRAATLINLYRERGLTLVTAEILHRRIDRRLTHRNPRFVESF